MRRASLAVWLVFVMICCTLVGIGLVIVARAIASPHRDPWVSGISIRTGQAPASAKDAGNDLMFQVSDTVGVIPWAWQGGEKRNWRATVTLTVTSGSTVWFRPFGPTYTVDQPPFRLTPAAADSANTWTSVGPIDSLWAWCPSGSAWANGVCYDRGGQ